MRNLDTEQTQNRLKAAEVAPGADAAEPFIGDHESTLTPAAVDKLLTAKEPGQADPHAARGLLAFVMTGVAVWLLVGWLIWHAFK
jgi:hypothetical protein